MASLVIPAGALLGWELAVRAGWWPRTLIAAPSEVVAAGYTLLLSGALLHHAAVSGMRLLVGFGIGALLGLATGSLLAISKPAERLLNGTLQFLAPIPPVAWIPLIIIIFGIGEWSKITLIAVGSFFVLLLHTYEGIRATDSSLVEVSQVYGKTSMQLFWNVLLPSAVPDIFTGARQALALSWILLIAAEVIASASGLGWLIWDSRNFSRPDDMIVGMLCIGGLGKLSDMLLLLWQDRLLHWRRTYAKQDRTADPVLNQPAR